MRARTGPDFAAGIWVVDPAFVFDPVHDQVGEGDSAPALEDADFCPETPVVRSVG